MQFVVMALRLSFFSIKLSSMDFEMVKLSLIKAPAHEENKMIMTIGLWSFTSDSSSSLKNSSCTSIAKRTVKARGRRSVFV